tara:strand:- start:514 stop:630 length:117 start_codon:yes stop_codon:yes gene_type:complete
LPEAVVVVMILLVAVGLVVIETLTAARLLVEGLLPKLH